MHHNHTLNPALVRASRRLSSLFTHWTLSGLFLLALQFSPLASPVHATDDPGTGILLLHGSAGDLEALVLDAEISLQVQGLLADMTLVQNFRNTTNQWVEGRYLFPLPPDATVRGLQIKLGNRTITADIHPREAAKTAYAQARDAGQIASLVEQQRPNLFTVNLANIAPGETISVTLDVMLPVKVIDQHLQLRLPATLTPRYANAVTTDATAISSPFNRPSRIRGPRLNMSLTIEPLDDYASVSSATHTLQNSAAGLEISNSPMDRDILLDWPAQFAQDASIQAYVASHDHARYVQLLVNPPTSIVHEERLPRELIVIVDKSGSMAGVAMRAAIEALNYAIDGLSENDYLNIVAFDDRHVPLFSRSRLANQEVRLKARRFADRLDADGGTEMGSALSFALQSGEGSSQRLRQIVFITDGSVGYEELLLQRIRDQLADNRLFTVGIGPSPNTWFLEKAAEAGRGIAVSIQNEHDVAHAITDLLDGLSHPVLTDMSVQFPQGYGEIYPHPLPDLYAERPGMWVARITDEVDEIVITAKHNGERWRQSVQIPVDSPRSSMAVATSAPAVAMDWTRRKIDSLLDEQRYSTDRELHKDAITQLAMNAGLVTQYTSFVAMEEQPVRGGDQSLTQQQVTNLIPRGNQMMNISLPQGAAGVDTLAMLSLILSVAALGLRHLSRCRDC